MKNINPIFLLEFDSFQAGKTLKLLYKNGIIDDKLFRTASKAMLSGDSKKLSTLALTSRESAFRDFLKRYLKQGSHERDLAAVQTIKDTASKVKDLATQQQSGIRGQVKHKLSKLGGVFRNPENPEQSSEVVRRYVQKSVDDLNSQAFDPSQLIKNKDTQSALRRMQSKQGLRIDHGRNGVTRTYSMQHPLFARNELADAQTNGQNAVADVIEKGTNAIRNVGGKAVDRGRFIEGTQPSLWERISGFFSKNGY